MKMKFAIALWGDMAAWSANIGRHQAFGATAQRQRCRHDSARQYERQSGGLEAATGEQCNTDPYHAWKWQVSAFLSRLWQCASGVSGFLSLWTSVLQQCSLMSWSMCRVVNRNVSLSSVLSCDIATSSCFLQMLLVG